MKDKEVAAWMAAVLEFMRPYPVATWRICKDFQIDIVRCEELLLKMEQDGLVSHYENGSYTYWTPTEKGAMWRGWENIEKYRERTKVYKTRILELLKKKPTTQADLEKQMGLAHGELNRDLGELMRDMVLYKKPKGKTLFIALYPTPQAEPVIESPVIQDPIGPESGHSCPPKEEATLEQRFRSDCYLMVEHLNALYPKDGKSIGAVSTDHRVVQHPGGMTFLMTFTVTTPEQAVVIQGILANQAGVIPVAQQDKRGPTPGGYY